MYLPIRLDGNAGHLPHKPIVITLSIDIIDLLDPSVCTYLSIIWGTYLCYLDVLKVFFLNKLPNLDVPRLGWS